MTETTGLIRYDAMVRAIAECVAIDEAKDLRDKAHALQIYANQAKNRQAESQAAEVRIRAERQTKILMRDGQENGTIATQSHHGKGIQTSVAPIDTRTLSDLNITRDQSSKWGKLADIPDDEFEARLADARERGDVPTTDGIIAAPPTVSPIDKRVFEIGAAMRSVCDLRGIDVLSALGSMPAKMRGDLVAQIADASDVLAQIINQMEVTA